MKLRIAAIAFLIATLTVGLCWLSLQPVLARLLEALQRTAPPGTAEHALWARTVRMLPLLLGAHLVAGGALAFAVLYLTVARPLGRAVGLVDQLSTLKLDLDAPLDRGGPLVSRLSGALGRLTAALRDEQATTRRQVNALQHTNQRLSRAQAELAAAERLATVGKLAAGVAHEVGNPLSGILGYLSLAQARAKADPQLADFLQRIDAEVQRIDQIVRGLLDLGRSGKGAGATTVDAASVVENAVRLLGKGPDFQKVAVALELPQDAAVRAESGALAQVVINLLLNAAQAMGGDGRIVVRGERSDGKLRLHVEDTGPGIAADALPHLFEPFFTTKEAGQGSGLGLAISRHLVESMGGALEAGNRPEGGARFTLTLPAA
ncbi:MAG TPA: HAMP domain-containing sensor histidine kinase [Myxococcaceae bacterium]|nr:HAMP domain-containing sensor histidine kinase [Myxococcaceae bacterium]